MASTALPLKYHKTETKQAPLKRSHTEMERGVLWRSGALGHCPGQSQNNAGCRKHRCKFRACADQPGPPHRCGCGILDPLVFQLGFSRLFPHHLHWNPIFCCPPPPPTLLFGNEGMGVASHNLQHRQSQMLPVHIPRWPGGFPTVSSTGQEACLFAD